MTDSSLLQFAAYYYNAALCWNKEVVATYKDGYNNNGEVYDYERVARLTLRILTG